MLSVVEIEKEGNVIHEGEHSSADREGKGHDEKHEESHLCYKQEEDLDDNALAHHTSTQPWEPYKARRVEGIEVALTYKTVVERHLVDLS